jgi:hypothetical protein
MGDRPTRFVVKRLNWAEEWGGKRARRPGEVAVASFDTREAADAECAAREAAFREAVNPFDCGPAVHCWTHLDEPRLRDWLMDHGVDPPKPQKGVTDWTGWWKKSQKKLGAAGRAAVWEALDKVRFFAVREEPVRPVGYAVVMVNWQYNDEYYDADPQGGRLVQVYRSRERAEAACADANADAREVWSDIGEDIPDELEDDDTYVVFDATERTRRRKGLIPGEALKKGEGAFKSTAGVPFYEVIEVELEGLE